MIIVLKNNNGKVSAINLDQSNFVLPTPTLAEINYEAFNIASKDYHNELYSYLQDLAELYYVTDVDKFLLNSEMITEELKCESKNPKTKTIYHTLPCKIRNNIDHSNNGNNFSNEELMLSTEFLCDICRKLKKDNEKTSAS